MEAPKCSAEGGSGHGDGQWLCPNSPSVMARGDGGGAADPLFVCLGVFC